METEKTDNTVMGCIDSDQMLSENTVETMLGRKETMGMLLLLKSYEKVGKNGQTQTKKVLNHTSVQNLPLKNISPIMKL